MNNKRYVFKIGDKVRILFSEAEGVIVDFYDAETALVDMNGDEMPIFLEHLEQVPDLAQVAGSPKLDECRKSDGRPKSGKQSKPADGQATAKTNETAGTQAPDFGINLFLQPVYDANTAEIVHFLIHLHNNTGKTFVFDYRMWVNGYEVFDFSRKLGGREAMMLNALEFDQLNDAPELRFDFRLQRPQTEDVSQMVKSVKPKARMLRKPPQHNLTIGQPTYEFALCNTWQKKDRETANVASKKSRARSIPSKLQTLLKRLDMEDVQGKLELNVDFRIVDLHIEKLRSDYRCLTNKQMLEFQLSHFEKELTKAIKKREANMLAIHGLGKGKLRSELIKTMRQYPQVKRFEQNPRFGHGATEIIFEYKQ